MLPGLRPSPQPPRPQGSRYPSFCDHFPSSLLEFSIDACVLNGTVFTLAASGFPSVQARTAFSGDVLFPPRHGLGITPEPCVAVAPAESIPDANVPCCAYPLYSDGNAGGFRGWGYEKQCCRGHSDAGVHALSSATWAWNCQTVR